MNLIYITGAPRCGKSTLAGRIAKEHSNVSVLSLDAFSKSVRFVFNDFKMYSGKTVLQPDINQDVFLKMIEKYIEAFNEDYPNQTLIAEGCHFSPDEFEKKSGGVKIICLGITSSKERVIESIKTKAWMAQLPECKINEYADLILNYSIKMKEKSDKNYLYFDIDNIDYSRIIDYIFKE